MSKTTKIFDFLGARLPASSIVPTPSNGLYLGLTENRCNAIAGCSITTAEGTVRKLGGFEGPYAVGKTIFLREYGALATRSDDPEWSDFVNLVMQSLIAAELKNITQETASAFMNTSVFGVHYENMFSNAIATDGNYAELISNVEEFLPRNNLNMLHTNDTTGLIYSTAAFGDVQNTGPGPTSGGTLEVILKRNKLRCAVRPNRPGFAQYNSSTMEWRGFDVDYCRVLASSVFRSNRTSLEYVPFDDDIGSMFMALVNGEVDVIAGVGMTLERDVQEPTTGEGFSFTRPYFYTPTTDAVTHLTSEKTLSLVTRQDDPQWSKYVYWIVEATIYAEERGITALTSFRMPRVDILGPSEDGFSFVRMLRDAILVGNYGELYERNVEAFIPRGGRNKLNVEPYGPQHYVYM